MTYGGLSHYLTKPWKPAELVDVVKSELTKYVVQSGTDPLPYFAVLDPEQLLEFIGKRGGAE